MVKAIAFFSSYFLVLASLSSLFLVPVLASSQPTHHAIARELSAARQAAYLRAHNDARREVGSAPLVWNTTLANMAEQWTDGCIFSATEGVLADFPYGENIAAATGRFSISAAVGLFTADQDRFDPSNPEYSHWTQVVWKGTKSLGCSINTFCEDLFGPNQRSFATLQVCFYDPPGNVIGDSITANVGA